MESDKSGQGGRLYRDEQENKRVGRKGVEYYGEI